MGYCDDMFEIDGYSLDFRLVGVYGDSSTHKEELKMIIIFLFFL